MFRCCSLLLLLLVCCAALWSSNAAADLLESNVVKNVTIIIEHALVPSMKQYQPRANIQLVTKADGKQGLIIPAKNGINSEGLADFKKLLDSNGLYTIRMRSASGSENAPYVIASIPACELQKSGFKEDLNVFLDKSNNLVGVSYSSPSGPMQRSCDSKMITESMLKFQTRLKMGEEFVAQVIPLQAAGSRPANLQDAKLGLDEDAENKPPQQSFLRRYIPEMAQVMQATKTALITKSESYVLMKNMLRISISSICYMRDIFPKECFKNKDYGTVPIHQLQGAQKEADGTVSITHQDAFLLTQWLEKGVFKALEAEYLHSLTFALYTKHPISGEDLLLEVYEFKLGYQQNSNGGASSAACAPPMVNNVPLHSKETVKNQAGRLIRSLAEFTGTLDSIPEERWITLQLKYNDNTPADYEPEYFQAADTSIFFNESLPLVIKVGGLQTPDLSMQLRFAGLESLLFDDLCKVGVDDTTATTVNENGTKLDRSSSINNSNSHNMGKGKSQASVLRASQRADTYGNTIQSSSKSKNKIKRNSTHHVNSNKNQMNAVVRQKRVLEAGDHIDRSNHSSGDSSSRSNSGSESEVEEDNRAVRQGDGSGSGSGSAGFDTQLGRLRLNTAPEEAIMAVAKDTYTQVRDYIIQEGHAATRQVSRSFVIPNVQLKSIFKKLRENQVIQVKGRGFALTDVAMCEHNEWLAAEKKLKERKEKQGIKVTPKELLTSPYSLQGGYGTSIDRSSTAAATATSGGTTPPLCQGITSTAKALRDPPTAPRKNNSKRSKLLDGRNDIKKGFAATLAASEEETRLSHSQLEQQQQQQLESIDLDRDVACVLETAQSALLQQHQQRKAKRGRNTNSSSSSNHDRTTTTTPTTTMDDDNGDDDDDDLEGIDSEGGEAAGGGGDQDELQLSQTSVLSDFKPLHNRSSSSSSSGSKRKGTASSGGQSVGSSNGDGGGGDGARKKKRKYSVIKDPISISLREPSLTLTTTTTTSSRASTSGVVKMHNQQ